MGKTKYAKPFDVVVKVTGGQGFIPRYAKVDERGNRVITEAMAQNIIDRYGGDEYFDEEELQYYVVESFWMRIRQWWSARPRLKNIGWKWSE